MRNILENLPEHLEKGSKNIRRPHPPFYDHYNTTGHLVSIDYCSIVGKEDQNLMRTIKEALYIRVNNPSLNRNIGKYHLPHIWDEVLHNTSELKITQENRPYGYFICQLGYNIYQAPSPTLSGNSICHLAITSAIFSQYT